MMKKVALMIKCAIVCVYIATFQYAYAQTAEGINAKLEFEDNNEIWPQDPSVRFVISGAPQLEYLHIQSLGKYAATKIGYNAERVYDGDQLNTELSGHEFIEITVKSLNGFYDWNKVKIAPNDLYLTHYAVLGNYENSAENLGDGWLKFKIPLSAIGIYNYSHLTLPNAFGVDMGVKEIVFTGNGVEDFEWFSENKFDNARKDSQPGQSELLLSNDNPMIKQLILYQLAKNEVTEKVSMPFDPIKVSLKSGENKFVGEVIDVLGNTYYTDTLTYSFVGGATAQITPASCNGGADGSINLTVEGISQSYSYLWSNGSSSEDVAGLSSGSYTVNITDEDGKKSSATFYVGEPNAFTATLENVNCSEEQAVLKVANGYGPYEYSIDGNLFENLGEEAEDVFYVRFVHANVTAWRYKISGLGTDKDDNIYVSGMNHGLLLVDGTDGTAEVGTDGAYGIYITKLLANGSASWSRNITFDQEGDDLGYGLMRDMTVDENGNSLVIIDLFQGATIMPENIHVDRGYLLLQYDSEGNLLRYKKADGYMYVNEVHTDKDNNIYLAGAIRNVNNEGNGGSDLLLSKYDPSWNLVWQKRFDGKDWEISEDMEVSAVGDIYITGSYRGDMNFDDIKLPFATNRDAFVAKLNANGKTLWAKAAYGINDVIGEALVQDDMGNLFVAIDYYQAGGYDGTSLDESALYIMRLNTVDGSMVWARPLYSTEGATSDAYDMVVFNDRLYVTAEGGEPLPNPEGILHFGNGLFEFDYDANLYSYKRLASNDPYSRSFGTFLDITRDNHLIYSKVNSGSGIYKYGSSMQDVIEIPGDAPYVTVRDANGCEYMVKGIGTQPDSPAICSISSMDDGNYITINGTASTAYNIYKETTSTDNFEFIGTATGNEFFDDASNAWERSFKYVVTAVNECEVESEYSDYHRTMHLTVNEGNLGQINLIWDGYEGFEYDSYDIYRGSSADDMEYLTSVPSYLFTYTDLNPSIYAQYYQIVVGSDNGCDTESANISTGRTAETKRQRTASSNIATKFGEAGNLSMYPVPAKDRVSVKFSPDGNDYVLKVIDNRGRIVQTQEGIHNEAVINRGNLPAGLYTITLSSGSGEPMHGRIVFK